MRPALVGGDHDRRAVLEADRHQPSRLGATRAPDDRDVEERVALGGGRPRCEACPAGPERAARPEEGRIHGRVEAATDSLREATRLAPHELAALSERRAPRRARELHGDAPGVCDPERRIDARAVPTERGERKPRVRAYTGLAARGERAEHGERVFGEPAATRGLEEREGPCDGVWEAQIVLEERRWRVEEIERALGPVAAERGARSARAPTRSRRARQGHTITDRGARRQGFGRHLDRRSEARWIDPDHRRGDRSRGLEVGRGERVLEGPTGALDHGRVARLGLHPCRERDHELERDRAIDRRRGLERVEHGGERRLVAVPRRDRADRTAFLGVERAEVCGDVGQERASRRLVEVCRARQGDVRSAAWCSDRAARRREQRRRRADVVEPSEEAQHARVAAGPRVARRLRGGRVLRELEAPEQGLDRARIERAAIGRELERLDRDLGGVSLVHGREQHDHGLFAVGARGVRRRSTWRDRRSERAQREPLGHATLRERPKERSHHLVSAMERCERDQALHEVRARIGRGRVLRGEGVRDLGLRRLGAGRVLGTERVEHRRRRDPARERAHQRSPRRLRIDAPERGEGRSELARLFRGTRRPCRNRCLVHDAREQGRRGRVPCTREPDDRRDAHLTCLVREGADEHRRGASVEERGLTVHVASSREGLHHGDTNLERWIERARDEEARRLGPGRSAERSRSDDTHARVGVLERRPERRGCGLEAEASERVRRRGPHGEARIAERTREERDAARVAERALGARRDLAEVGVLGLEPHARPLERLAQAERGGSLCGVTADLDLPVLERELDERPGRAGRERRELARRDDPLCVHALAELAREARFLTLEGEREGPRRGHPAAAADPEGERARDREAHGHPRSSTRTRGTSGTHARLSTRPRRDPRARGLDPGVVRRACAAVLAHVRAPDVLRGQRALLHAPGRGRSRRARGGVRALRRVQPVERPRGRPCHGDLPLLRHRLRGHRW
jgi:hypothetical protein